MKLLSIVFVSLIASQVFANDGGVYYIPVEKMKQEKSESADTKLLLTFEGKKAEVLRKSLPKQMSAIKIVTDHINSLALVDEKSQKMVLITCSNAEFDELYTKVTSTKTTKCSLEVVEAPKSSQSNESFLEMLGDATELTAPACSK